MNVNMNTYDPSIGYYTGNDPGQASYYGQYPSTFTTNAPTYAPYFTQLSDENACNINLRQKLQPLDINSNGVNKNNLDLQHQFDMSNFQKHDPPPTDINIYSFENARFDAETYYDRIRAQILSNQQLNTMAPASTNHLNNDYSHSQLSLSNPIAHTTPIIPNNGEESTFVVTSASVANKSSSLLQHPILTVSTFTPAPFINHSESTLLTGETDPSLEYLHYSMDSLIERLVPTDTYIPKQSFIYPMLLCSRMHIRPSLLFNRLARLTIKSIASLTFDQSIRTMNNFLYVLSQWTRTFPYDFRNSEMMSQFDDLHKKIISFESSLQSDLRHIQKKLLSKLKALDNYEEYIRQLNKKTMYNLNQLALITDIMHECATPISFAQQLTHIELDRLKPVGAEELIQYFIMKLASEEARVHPSRNNQVPPSAPDDESSGDHSKTLIHDNKLTFCLEAYIQWFNRLTFFITTEIVKHTQRRSRVRLINYFIDAAYECFRIQNFNSMIGILGGLNMQPVRRLKRTWGKVQTEKFKQLEQYMNVSKNFATYRLILKIAMEEAERHQWTTDKIVIPFTSIILQDVYYIKTHSKDYTTAGGINLKKYYSMANFISEEFVRCKQSKCSFERNDVIINYIITSPTFNEDSLMLASFECEPPASFGEKEKYRTLKKSTNPAS